MVYAIHIYNFIVEHANSVLHVTHCVTKFSIVTLDMAEPIYLYLYIIKLASSAKVALFSTCSFQELISEYFDLILGAVRSFLFHSASIFCVILVSFGHFNDLTIMHPLLSSL